MSLIPLPYKIIALLLLVAALVAGYFGWQTHQRAIGAEEQRLVDAQAIQAQKDEAGRIMAEKTAEVRATEKTLRAFVDAQEVQSVKAQKVVADLGRQLRDAAVAGRLYDPYARPGDCGPAPDSGTAAPPGDSAGDSAEAAGVLPAEIVELHNGEPDPEKAVTGPAPGGGLLSVELSNLLLEITGEADEMNNAYTACRRWAVEVKEQTSVP